METLSQHSDWSNGIHFESLANLAHELRTPVQVLLGYLDILRDDRGDDRAYDEPESSNHAILERMNANVHELAQTVENVLEFALAYAGAENALAEEIDLAGFFADLDEVLQASHRSQHVSVRINLTAAPARVITRRRPLRSIVLNLAINALKFTTHGEVAISVRGCGKDQEEMEVEVRDSGPGISGDFLSSAFEPLVQLSKSSVRNHRGLGLGLSIVQRNVDALRGKLQVESVPGVGSCFKVTIPCTHSVPPVCTSNHSRSNSAY